MLIRKTIKRNSDLIRWVRRYKRRSKGLIYSDRLYLRIDTPRNINNEEGD